MSFLVKLIALGGPILIAVLGGYTVLFPPLEKHKRRWPIGFLILGVISTGALVLMQQEADSKIETMLTGGSDYAYFRAAPNDLKNTNGPYQLWIVGVGNTYAVNYWISPESARMNGNDPAYGSLDAIKPRINIINSGPHPSTRGLPLGNYIIQFAAKNGEWRQLLRIFIADGHAQQTVTYIDQTEKAHEIDVH